MIEQILEIISMVLILIGSIFYFLGTLGIVRFPDLYTRLHASTKSIVLGACGIILGVILLEGISAASVKAFLIMIFLLLTAPIASHAIARAGYFSGAKMCPQSVVDEYRPHVLEEKKEKLAEARRVRRKGHR